MKRKANLYKSMLNIEDIKYAMKMAAKGKRRYPHVQRILANEDKYAQKVLGILEARSFCPSPYTHETIRENSCKKTRDVSKPRYFPDQVVHWSIYQVLRPWLFKRFYALSCGSVPGRGVHYGKRFVERWVVRNRKHTKYYLKMDVQKFYQSIQPDKLMVKLRRVIKDEEFLAINERILSMDSGLPIGMLLSQVYANYFLTDFDFWVKQELGAKYYIRYMDDMVIFGNNKRKLHEMRRKITERLNQDGLRLKPNWQVCRFDKEPLDFMGFRFFRGHTILRKSIMHAITRKCRKAGKRSYRMPPSMAASIMSYMGWLKHADTYRLYRERIRPFMRIRTARRVLRRAAKGKEVKA